MGLHSIWSFNAGEQTKLFTHDKSLGLASDRGQKAAMFKRSVLHWHSSGTNYPDRIGFSP